MGPLWCTARASMLAVLSSVGYPRSRMTFPISVCAAPTASAGVSTNRSWIAAQSPL
jgi:hypothetical protein